MIVQSGRSEIRSVHLGRDRRVRPSHPHRVRTPCEFRGCAKYSYYWDLAVWYVGSLQLSRYFPRDYPTHDDSSYVSSSLIHTKLNS